MSWYHVSQKYEGSVNIACKLEIGALMPNLNGRFPSLKVHLNLLQPIYWNWINPKGMWDYVRPKFTISWRKPL